MQYGTIQDWCVRSVSSWYKKRVGVCQPFFLYGGGGGNRAPLGDFLSSRSAPVFFASGGFLPPLPRLARRSKAVRFQHFKNLKKHGDGKDTIPVFF